MFIAHRGLICIENSVKGIRTASKIADMVELDVRFNTCKNTILCHDRELRNADDNETLAELCDYSQPMNLMIDIKAFGIQPAIEIAVNIFDIIQRFPQHTYHLCSFNEFCVSKLLEMRRKNTSSVNYTVGVITSGIPLNLFANLNDIDFVSMDYNIICEDIVDIFHNLGKIVYSWTVNSTEMQNYALHICKVDGLICDLYI